MGEKFGSISTGISSKFQFMGRRKSSAAPLNAPPTGIFETAPARAKSPSPTQRDSTEMDLERLGVRVDRSYSVHTAND
jgi:hypothetical protein